MCASNWKIADKTVNNGGSDETYFYDSEDDYFDCTLQGSATYVARGTELSTGNRELGPHNFGKDWNKMVVRSKRFLPTCNRDNPYFFPQLNIICSWLLPTVDRSLGYWIPEVALYKCTNINEIAYDEAGSVEVWLRGGNLGCAYVDTFGVDEPLRKEQSSSTCSADQNKKFIAFPEANGSERFKVVLRPLQAVRYSNFGKVGLNVCLKTDARTMVSDRAPRYPVS